MSFAFPTAPVVLLVYNRPDHTRKVLEQIRLAKPSNLLVVADGPRPDRPQDQAACAEVRALVETGIDWKATVQTNYAPANMGLRQRVSSGLTWAFQQVEQAIILEDDCVPDPSFFPFCSELLQRYEHDARVGAIAGDSYQPQPFACPSSYYFSRYPHCWGWATWRRAWKFFDESMMRWPPLRDAGWLHDLFPNPLEAEYWRQIFDLVSQREINSWAYVWTFSCWSQNLLTALPRVNLVNNIGVGSLATNTQDAHEVLHHAAIGAMQFPLVHPETMTRHGPADAFSQEFVFGRARDPSLRGRLLRLYKKCRRLPGRMGRILRDSPKR